MDESGVLAAGHTYRLLIRMTDDLRANAGNPFEDDSSSLSLSFSVTSMPPVCSADLTGDGQLDFFDVSAFLTAFGNTDPIADFNGDGAFDFFDVSAFLTVFGEGCP